MKPLVVPIDLGGSPHRWALQAPARPPPTPTLVDALVQHYRTERRTHPDQPLEVAFFHGGLPSAELLQAAGAHTKRLACLPGDLTPAAVDHLQAHGVHTIELDVGTAAPIRRSLGRRLSAAALARLIQGLRDRGIRVGVTLSPGLPGASHTTALQDIDWLVDLDAVDLVRLHPALAWADSRGAQWVADGRWTPMSVAQALTTLEPMMDRLDTAGIAVARVGLQPGPDLRARVVAGPVHPNLRALVDTRRFRRRIRAAIQFLPRARVATVRVHPADLSQARGEANRNIRALRAELHLTALHVRPDPTVPRGTVRPGAATPEPSSVSPSETNLNKSDP